MERAALDYLARFASSRAKVEAVLRRRVKRAELAGAEPGDALATIAALLEKLQRLGLLDDVAYAAARQASLRRKGESTRHIRARLAQAGIDPDTSTELERAEPDDAERQAADAFARRRRLGRYRTPGRPFSAEKELAAMARAGFSLGLARRTLAGHDDDKLGT